MPQTYARGRGKVAVTVVPLWNRRSLDDLSRRERIAAVALAVVASLIIAAGIGTAVLTEADEAPGASGIPSDWAGLEPLLPLVPSLKDIAARKGTASGKDSGSGFAPGLTPAASWGKRATGAGQAGLASEGSGAKGRPSVRARRRGRQSGGRSAAEGRSSRRFSPGSPSSSGTSAPRRATQSRPSTPPRHLAPARPRRSSPPPEPKPRRGGGHSKPVRPRRSSRAPSASPRMRHIGRGKHAGRTGRRMAERGARGR